MRNRFAPVHIGLRTLKTTAAIILSMALVYFYGTTSSKYIFAMLGAMAAVQPTFRESLEACMTQFVGLIFGAVVGVLLLMLPVHPLIQCAIGILLVITLYNTLRISYSPSLPCMIVVLLCTTPDIQPIPYAIGRFWDSTIGLGIGMVINTLVFPYDNSRLIRSTLERLDKELIAFLEDMFDGDDDLATTEKMAATIDEIASQMHIFSRQKLLLHRRRQHDDLEVFHTCTVMARELVAQAEVLCRMGKPGQLNGENHQRLGACGVQIADQDATESSLEKDVVTNYHVSQILTLRQELLDALKNNENRPLT